MAKGRHSNIELHAYGLSHKSGKIQSMGGKKKIKVKTLSEALQANGHSQAEITYLRVSRSQFSQSKVYAKHVFARTS